MTGATIDVQHPPAGWSHLSGPLRHVLVALDDGDERYARAASAAAAGDLDDVLDVLASTGMRRTPAFVAVAGAARPRVVTQVPWWRGLLADVSPSSATRPARRRNRKSGCGRVYL